MAAYTFKLQHDSVFNHGWMACTQGVAREQVPAEFSKQALTWQTGWDTAFETPPEFWYQVKNQILADAEAPKKTVKVLSQAELLDAFDSSNPRSEIMIKNAFSLSIIPHILREGLFTIVKHEEGEERPYSQIQLEIVVPDNLSE